jgi:hypothetical protein
MVTSLSKLIITPIQPAASALHHLSSIVLQTFVAALLDKSTMVLLAFVQSATARLAQPMEHALPASLDLY